MKELTSYNRVAGYLNKVFDLLNEEFFEIESKHYICDEDIAEWWEDNKNE